MGRLLCILVASSLLLPACRATEPRTVAAARPPAAAAACGCPWRTGIALEELKSVPRVLIRRDGIHCRGQVTCELRGREENGRASFAPCRASDPLPIDMGTGRGFPWAQPNAVRRVATVDDGWIVSVPRREMDGWIFWVARDGSSSRLLESATVAELVATTAGVWVATGPQHMGSDAHGEARLIARDGSGTWAVVRRTAVGSAAHAATVGTDDALVVATRGQIVRVSRDGQAEALHTFARDTAGQDEPALVPTSVLLHGGELYVGMTGGIVLHLVPGPGGYREDWLAPIDCPDGEWPLGPVDRSN